MRGTGRVQNKGGSGGEGVGEVVWIEGGPMDEIGLAEKSPPETVGGRGRNCQSRQRNKRSEKWKWREGFGDWYSCWALTDREPGNRTKPCLFCLHPALVQHLEDCIRKHRRSLMCQNTSLNA